MGGVPGMMNASDGQWGQAQQVDSSGQWSDKGSGWGDKNHSWSDKHNSWSDKGDKGQWSDKDDKGQWSDKGDKKDGQTRAASGMMTKVIRGRAGANGSECAVLVS